MSTQPSPGQGVGTSPAAPPLLVADVRIQDFRGLSHLCVSLERLTVFVGENNAGKSSLLLALAAFFGAHRATEDDLHVAPDGTRAGEFVIDVRFVPWSGLKFDQDVQSRFLGMIQVPQDPRQSHYFTVRAIGKVSSDGSGINLERRFLRGWPIDRATAATIGILTARPGREHLDLVSFFLLDARRDLVEELRNRTSHWGRLLADLELDPVARTDIEAALAVVGTKIVDSSPVLSSVRSGLGGVKEALGNSVSDVRISPVPGRIDDLARAVDVLIARSAGPALPLRLQGHGSRSLAAVMVFEAFVKQRTRPGGAKAPLVISAFEEPEAHLHPQAHRAMVSIIAALDGQKLISTHSPHVARVTDIHSVRSLTRDANGVPRCRAVPRESSGTPTFSDPDLASIRRFVQRNNGEILFARAVIVVEGDTEDFALPVFALKHWGKDHGLIGLSFAHTGGAGNGKHVVRVLEYLGVPWVLLADGDLAGQKGQTAIETALSRSLQPAEFVRLPNGHCFEAHLIATGYRVALEEAITGHYGASALAAFKSRMHGSAISPTATRDYLSVGWEDRLLLDFCHDRKGSIGEVLAHGVVNLAAQHGLPVIPATIHELFEKADAWLK